MKIIFKKNSLKRTPNDLHFLQKGLKFTLTRVTFPYINTLAHPAGSARRRRDNQSMRECCFGQKEREREHWLVGVNFFSYVKARKVDSVGRVTHFSGTTFLLKSGS